MQNKSTCQYCHWAVKNSYGDIICLNTESDNHMEWILAGDTCEVWTPAEDGQNEKE